MLYELDEQDFNAFLREVDLDFFYKEVLGYGQNSPPEWREIWRSTINDEPVFQIHVKDDVAGVETKTYSILREPLEGEKRRLSVSTKRESDGRSVVKIEVANFKDFQKLVAIIKKKGNDTDGGER